MYSACTPKVGETLNVAPIPPFQPVLKESLNPPTGISTPAPTLMLTGLSWALAGATKTRRARTATTSFRIEHTPLLEINMADSCSRIDREGADASSGEAFGVPRDG